MVDRPLSRVRNAPIAPAAVSISPRTIFITLSVISVMLILISFLGVVILAPYEGNPYTGDLTATQTGLSKLVVRFDVIKEGNIPSWYSGVLLFMAAAVLALIAAKKFSQQDRFRWHWLVLSVLFVGFSLDEVAYLHEGIGHFLDQSEIGTFGLGWLLPAAGFVLVVGVWFVPFILHLPKHPRSLVILSAVLFLTGAFMLELVENVLLRTHDMQSSPVLSVNHLQDLFEMIGVSLFIYALLAYIRAHISPLRLVVR